MPATQRTCLTFSARGTVGFARNFANAGLFFSTSLNANSSPSTFSNALPWPIGEEAEKHTNDGRIGAQTTTGQHWLQAHLAGRRVHGPRVAAIDAVQLLRGLVRRRRRKLSPRNRGKFDRRTLHVSKLADYRYGIYTLTEVGPSCVAIVCDTILFFFRR